LMFPTRFMFNDSALPALKSQDVKDKFMPDEGKYEQIEQGVLNGAYTFSQAEEALNKLIRQAHPEYVRDEVVNYYVSSAMEKLRQAYAAKMKKLRLLRLRTREQIEQGVLNGAYTFSQAEALLKELIQEEQCGRHAPETSPAEAPAWIAQAVDYYVSKEMKKLRRSHARVNSLAYKARELARVEKQEARANQRENDLKAREFAKGEKEKARAKLLNSPEYKAKAAARAKKREEKAKEEARAREAKMAAKAEARARDARIREAEEGVMEVEAGVLRGTHTIEQFKVAAREFFQSASLELPHKFSRPGDSDPGLSNLRWRIAERRMQEVHEGVLAGTYSIEEAEEATTAFFMRGQNRMPIDEARLRADVAREMSGLQKKVKRMRDAQEKEDARNRLRTKREAERAEAIKTKLAAQAADKKLTDARRFAAKAKLEEVEWERTAQESIFRLNAARNKHHSARKDAELAAIRALKMGSETALAEKAFKAEAETWRELQDSERELKINNLVRQRVSPLGKRSAEQGRLKR